MIQRMLSNLLDNAIKYTPSGGKVSITVREHQEQVVVVVQDTGIGISNQDLPRIFERFFRCDQSRSQSGIGLGLSLARAIARAHGGRYHSSEHAKSGKYFHCKAAKIPFHSSPK